MEYSYVAVDIINNTSTVNTVYLWYEERWNSERLEGVIVKCVWRCLLFSRLSDTATEEMKKGDMLSGRRTKEMGYSTRRIYKLRKHQNVGYILEILT